MDAREEPTTHPGNEGAEVTLEDGRTLAYAEYGRRQGSPAAPPLTLPPVPPASRSVG